MSYIKNKLDIIATIIFAIILTVIMLWPITQTKLGSGITDKALHCAAFMILCLPLAYTGRYGLPSLMISAAIFGFAIELIQPIFNRSSDLFDWTANITGVLLALISAKIINFYTKSNN